MTKLSDCFDYGKHAVHAGVGIRQSTAIGIHRKIATRCRPLSRYKRAAFAFFTET
jgi:hypothetical protein